MGITAGPDGALWAADHNNRIWRITTAGAISSVCVANNAQPQGIVAGPDGALWFTESNRNNIRRLSIDPPPLKWSDLRYVFDIKEDCNGKEAIQA